MTIVSSAPAGVTLQEILELPRRSDQPATAPGAPIQESDFRPSNGQVISSAVPTAWVELDLAPGSYLVACYVPDDETGMLHAFMGMAALVTAGGSVEATPTGRLVHIDWLSCHPGRLTT